MRINQRTPPRPPELERNPWGRRGEMDGRAPTLGLLADLGVEPRPDHLLAGDDATRCGGVEMLRGGREVGEG